MAADHERCEACDFDGSAFDDDALLAALRALGPAWQELLARAGANLRIRPAPGVWSALEYAAHSRDISALHVYGVTQALTGTEPDFGPIAADEMIHEAAESYADLDPIDVGSALGVEATRLAGLADEAGSAAWDRGLTVEGVRSDVRRLLEHALHDSQHHLADVEQGLALLVADHR